MRAIDQRGRLLLVTGLIALVALLTLLRQLRDRANPQRRLSLALRKRRFEPFVQPIVEVQTGRCVGGEVLMRWAHPARGILPPVEFIELAEDSRLIVPMSEIVMTKARDRLARVLERHDGLYCSFNITSAQLRDPACESRLTHIFDATSLPRQHLLLELTERAFVDRNSLSSLRALRESGDRLAIDDFGTGHSSLATIEQLPLDRIKIDREFVRTIESDTVTRPVLDTIITLAHALKIPMIAEGIETQAQWDYLAARGVQYVQGFLIARPMSTDDFDDWIDEYQAVLPTIASGPLTPRRVAAISEQRPRTSTAETAMPKLELERQVADMRGIDGVDVRDRMYALRRYPLCFVGRKAVDWLANRLQVSRATAVRIGERMAALGFLRHVVEEHDFADAFLFFRFVSSDAEIANEAKRAPLPDLDGVLAEMRGENGLVSTVRRRHLIDSDACFTRRHACEW